MSTTHTPWPKADGLNDDDWDGTQMIAILIDVVINNTVMRVESKPIVLLNKIDDLTATRMVETYTGHHDALHEAWHRGPALCPQCTGLMGYAFSFLASSTHSVHLSKKACWHCPACGDDYSEDDVTRTTLTGHEMMHKLSVMKAAKRF